MRKRGRTDSNQAEIVKVLRQWGISVQPISGLGKGVPDLLCGHRGRNFLLEVKDGGKPPSARKLTKDEMDWYMAWAGHVAVVGSPQQALNVILGESQG